MKCIRSRGPLVQSTGCPRWAEQSGRQRPARPSVASGRVAAGAGVARRVWGGTVVLQIGSLRRPFYHGDTEGHGVLVSSCLRGEAKLTP